MVILCRMFSWPGALVNVKPDTFIRWHGKSFRLLWRWKSRPVGRPEIPKDLRRLIREMAAERIRPWGEERIATELKLKLAIRVSPRTVGKYLHRDGSVGSVANALLSGSGSLYRDQKTASLVPRAPFRGRDHPVVCFVGIYDIP
jgi:hypothetical protein